jgi:hypothetical protein
VQIKIEAILHGRTIDLRDQTADTRQAASVDTNAVADSDQLRIFLRRLRGALRLLDVVITDSYSAWARGRDAVNVVGRMSRWRRQRTRLAGGVDVSNADQWP